MSIVAGAQKVEIEPQPTRPPHDARDDLDLVKLSYLVLEQRFTRVHCTVYGVRPVISYKV